MGENYEAKASMILDGKADLLDDGKVVMMSTKRFNEDFWAAYSKSIPKIRKDGKCPECGYPVFGVPYDIYYCRSCGQKIVITEGSYDEEDGD